MISCAAKCLRKFFLLGWVGLMVWTCFAVASDLPPKVGMLLVAQKSISDPRFHQSVILLVQHDDSGTGGLVINRPSRLSLQEVFADQPPYSELSGNLYYGGPVAPEMFLALAKTSSPFSESSEPVAEGIYMTGVAQLSEWLASHADFADYRIYTGYAGWAPGQLAAEMKRGDWQVLPADVENVFAEDSLDLWERLQQTRVM